MAARKKPVKKAARKKPVKKAARKKSAAKKVARKKAAKGYALGGIIDKITGKKKPKAKAKKPAKPIRMSSLYNEERKATNMLKKHGQGRRGMSAQDKADYQEKYDAHKAAHPDLYRGPGGALDSWWKKRNPVEPKAPAPAPAPSMMSGGDMPRRPDPMAATQRAAVAAGSAPKRKSFVPEPAPSSRPIKIAPPKPKITHDNVSRPWTAQDIEQMMSGKGRPISTGVVNRQKPKRRGGRFGPGSPMGGTGRR
tara:strand:- start:2384 stop:3136 length:753 start_codon:yes stop_codon:yes gene_type:complete